MGTSSANVRPVAWFELNRVTDDQGEHPQYLVAGTRSAEGQPCDFTTMRVYTWNPKKSRYETAFIENDLCGACRSSLPRVPRVSPNFDFMKWVRSQGRARLSPGANRGSSCPRRTSEELWSTSKGQESQALNGRTERRAALRVGYSSHHEKTHFRDGPVRPRVHWPVRAKAACRTQRILSANRGNVLGI